MIQDATLPCTGQFAPVSASGPRLAMRARHALRRLVDVLLQFNVDGLSPGSIYLQLQSPCNSGAHPLCSFIDDKLIQGRSGQHERVKL